ncbi:MAG: cupin domain-containing protein [Candidatus Promineifilaceae bacterium]|nr:cupin domain-containing protein [Candidatus Promineifilaceae bacterium]
MTASMAPVLVEGDQDQKVQMGDVAMAFKVGHKQTAGGAAVHEWTLMPRKLAAPPHRHEHEDEIFHVLVGEATVMQDDEVATIGPGSYVVLPRGHFHTFWNSGDIPLRLLVIMTPGRLEEYFEQAGGLVRPGALPDMAALSRLMDQYGLTVQMERMGELMARYDLETDVPPPPSAGSQQGG